MLRTHLKCWLIFLSHHHFINTREEQGCWVRRLLSCLALRMDSGYIQAVASEGACVLCPLVHWGLGNCGAVYRYLPSSIP